MSIKKASWSCLVCLMVATGDAGATTLNAPDFEPLAGTTAAAQPDLAGVVLEDVLRPFQIDLGGGRSVTGTVQDRVVRSDVDNTLIFSYRILNDATSDAPIRIAGRTDYAGFTADVDWRSDGVGMIAPNFASRGADGSDISFLFNGQAGIDPGEDSYFFFIKTNATAYKEGNEGILAVTGANGNGSFHFTTFQPLVVPLPAAAWLFASGILGLVVVARQRGHAHGAGER